MRFRGRVWKVGDHVDTDVIIPAPYLVSTDPRELALHCLEPLRPELVRAVRPGDILVAGENFGCGSSREHAPLALKGLGLSCVVAKGFARIFFRNAINVGLPVVECPSAAQLAQEGELLEVDLEAGLVRSLERGWEHRAEPLPPFMRELLKAGGLVEYARRRLGR